MIAAILLILALIWIVPLFFLLLAFAVVIMSSPFYLAVGIFKKIKITPNNSCEAGKNF